MAYNKEAKLLLDQLNSSRDMLINLLEKYETVTQRTSSLHEACDQLMLDQVKIGSILITKKIRFFRLID